MASYSELKNIEEQKSERDSLTTQEESEDGLYLAASTRWNQVSRCNTLLAWYRRNYAIIATHLALLAVNLVIVTLYATKGSFASQPCLMQPIMASNPIKDRIHYELHNFELEAIYKSDGSVNEYKPSKLTGTPRPELEEAWDKLMAHSEVRVTKEELGGFKNDDSIIELTDGSGYYVTISVFHGLHCVRRLHKYIWSEVYYANVSDHDAFFLRRHTEHCLDWIRQYVQCHADPTLIPIHWTNNDDVPVSKDTGNRMCVNWDPFEEWMAEHSFDPFQPGLLVHPVFGIPEGVRHPGSKVALGVHELGTGGLLHSDGRKHDIGFKEDPVAV
ncbi:hypothetical protein F5Y19DRAFT_459850 [Xylariaceae sp. FL1651]|nr:hypothetical protein F5Y19DRAFT_459850 [Xylariaceae sp. FL1651]